jgi:hypothetical protein
MDDALALQRRGSNLRLTANQLSNDSLTVLRAAITALIAALNITQGSPNNVKLDMLATIVFLIMISPEYLVQK